MKRGVVLVFLTLLAACGADEAAVAPRTDFVSVAAALAEGEVAGFARVEAPRPLDLPADHGAHPDFRTEWWYWTGNLEDESGRPFAFQLTFFRSALAPRRPASASAWASNQSWMAHLAICDPEGGRHEARERFARGALGLAGASARPFRVWLEDWRAEATAEGIERHRLVARAADRGLELELELEALKPLVLQGEGGFSPKGEGPGNASMYLSFTRLAARGAIVIGGRRHPVRGRAWMDHEWSTSVLGPEVAGWDWFSIQLDDGRDLMLFQLRDRQDGGVVHADGTIVAGDGTSRRLAAAEFTIEVLRRWRSPVTGATYPSRWRLRLPGEGLDLELEPLVADQEMRLSVAYWEGAVGCRGRSPEGELTGRGFVELVGYSETATPAERSR